MDGSHIEHSDSDSGESWTILDDSPALADEAPGFPDSSTRHDGEAVEHNEKDEDTDGISIISDSDHESPTPYEHLAYPGHLSEQEDRPSETHIPEYILANQFTTNSQKEHESLKADDDFLMDNNGKLRTYVHRRNKRLSTVLNIIVLGSIITAAGVAIGHMWGVKDDCTLQSTQSINKILSNLYKLQEENAYLRSKLKELTLATNLQKKPDSQKLSPKHLRCKKVFEEPLNSKNVAKLTKCVDIDNSKTDKVLESHLVEPEYEKDFLSDIEKLKNVYKQNKSWLDDEVARRLKNEELSQKRLKYKLQSGKPIKVGKILKDENVERQLASAMEDELLNNKKDSATTEPLKLVEDKLRKVSYAESLKSEKDGVEGKTVNKRDISAVFEGNAKDYIHKRKPKKQQLGTVSEISLSDEEFKKDDRYAGPKQRTDRKKNDRHKLNKRQKRRNKYEQWEMKGGYMKDYDDFSISSAQENEFVLKNPDKNFLSRDFERKNYIEQFSETDDNVKSEAESNSRKIKSVTKSLKNEKDNGKQKKDKEADWYDRRAAIRSEARKKLEKELFGEITPNNAAWYFRRMQKREQCRVKGDNSTRRKTHKTNMNFKTKH